ncbi:hypothetical protein [Kitasatospora sp. NPDC008115]|uniref:hypothetical protein n=1 Tax=Kitasatospora sp. NPDC008115 TaxID=3364022 RepID=UPI0036EA9006
MARLGRPPCARPCGQSATGRYGHHGGSQCAIVLSRKVTKGRKGGRPLLVLVAGAADVGSSHTIENSNRFTLRLPTAEVSARITLPDHEEAGIKGAAPAAEFGGDGTTSYYFQEETRLLPGDTAEAKFTLDRPVALERPLHFAVLADGRTIGSGRVVNTLA